ncbi:MAG: hypothetical protein AXW13_02120 [Alcanivorax sp. Nap_24]|nr:MAG: hypothetical protein AXW13_02120 [Alcanivorax sp. Nap_24]
MPELALLMQYKILFLILSTKWNSSLVFLIQLRSYFQSKLFSRKGKPNFDYYLIYLKIPLAKH